MSGRRIGLDAGKFMENEKNVCPICGSKIIEKTINYSDWNEGRLLVVRDVPVRECEANGHRFFQAKVARSLELVFEADRRGQLKPIEIMKVPVVKLDLAA
jgi:YgiT-type zinc finger domain-containing protein